MYCAVHDTVSNTCMCHYYSSISMKVEYVVGEAKSALDDGKCVVIGLQNTGEVTI